MSRKATAAASAYSHWLPGFEPDIPTPQDDEPRSLISIAAQILDKQVPPSPATEAIELIPAPIPDERPAPPETETVLPARATAWRLTVAATSVPKPAIAPRLTPADFVGLASPVAKFNANLAAIELLGRIEAENRLPEAHERRELLRYTGWGSLSGAFNHDSQDENWRDRARQLQARLTAEDYESARASVNNSHYTSLLVIQAMWAAVERLGFKGGRVLEPSAGIGHFVGAMPPALAERSTITAVEIDRLSGRMLRALYGPSGVDVHITPFEKAAFPDQWFDLVITNVPFGKYKVTDANNRPYARFNIHNYFIARALDLTRAGGLVCLITSSYTLEGSQPARQYIASQAHLLGAIRLPKGTFADIAGTEVQTDILFLHKRQGTEATAQNWIKTVSAPSALSEFSYSSDRLFVNEWYAAHPEWFIGHLRMESNGYEKVPTAVFTGDLEPALRERINLLPQDVYQPAKTAPPLRAVVLADPDARTGTFQIHRGRLHRVSGQTLDDVHDLFNATQRARIAGMSTIRDHVRTLLDAQLSDDDDRRLPILRATLNNVYDRFVARYGYLSTRANALAFRQDPDYPLLLSLEYYDEEANTAQKAALFTQRTLKRIVAPTAVEVPTDALATSMQWRGRVDPAYMGELLGVSEEEVLIALSEAGHIFRDPVDEAWKTADEYLFGNVREKLRQARLSGPDYQCNVDALERVQPEDLPAASIAVRLGAVWIPASDVEAFTHDVFGLQDCQISYSAEAGAWDVQYNDWRIRQSIIATQEFGTARMHAIELVQCALNVQTPTVRDRRLDGSYAVNKDETLAAREKLGLIKERFSTWAFQDTERRERLCRLYNDLYNTLRPRKFDGSHLVLPGFSCCFELNPHQRNAIWRIVQSGNTGLFHAVGAGKTAVNIIASMELRRLGFANKPCHVVPNHMLMQYTAEFVRLYPLASVLMASKEDLAGDRRREFISRIATGSFDAIVITHSSFERIKTSPAFTVEFIQEVIHDIEQAIYAADSGGRSNRIVKQLELIKKSWKTRLEKASAQNKKDDLLTWEHLGIDWLFVDEAHLFKNLFRFSKMQVAGLPMANSERAFDLYIKTRYTMRLHDNRHQGVVFATATPIANTIAEMHTMMRYLQPQRLQELGLEQFDAWAATFGESVTALEIAPDGSGYRMHTRFARFINVPELMAIFGEVADIQTAEMLNLPVPKLRGGKPDVVACPSSEPLKAFVQTLVDRAAAIRLGTVKPTEDNMLAITTDGRKAALDFRMIAPDAPFDENGKVAACLEKIHDIWARTASFRGAQLVFCDMSSPKKGKGFSVYDDMRERLIAGGIPAGEIAFVHDAETDVQKARLFKNVREGRVRVLFGSTSKMGIGTNVQDRLIAEHDLDAPWRPCDVEQRSGRILRQGNTCEEVELYRYVTTSSFDSYMWQTLETKARFIAQVMRGDKSIRSVEDVALAALSYAEVKALASGNPLVIEKAGVDAEVARLSTLEWLWRNQRYTNESEVSRLPLAIAAHEKSVAAHQADVARLRPQQMASISIEIGKRHITGPDAVGAALRKIILVAKEEGSNKLHHKDRLIGCFGGLDLGVGWVFGEPVFFLAGNAHYYAKPYQTGPALVAALLSTHAGIPDVLAAAQAQLAMQRKRLADIELKLNAPFEQQARLDELLRRQDELNAELDITRDEVGSEQADAEAEEVFVAA
jgi:N12 class adenine-specific DNA methylase